MTETEIQVAITRKEAEIFAVKKEIEYETACWEEAPTRNKTEFLEMKHSDALHDLVGKQERLERELESLELLEPEPAERPKLPAAKTAYLAANHAVTVLLSLWFGVLVALIFTYSPAEMLENARRFWI